MTGPADPAAPTASALPSPSAFLNLPSTVSYSPTPSIIHLKRDLLLPVSFAPPSPTDAPHHAGGSVPVLNTRFGDFPHTSLIGQPYGSQVRATNLGHCNRKRKRRADAATGTGTTTADEDHNAAGFLHILAPTAELWTASLPHRTQVVYTPDSAFILHKLGVRPGSVLLEAGAGSGSFTHAGVRAVYCGYPDGREGPGGEGDVVAAGAAAPRRTGRVWSFEFHSERVAKLREEIVAHGLDGLVQVVHRDVCKDGFLIRRGGEEVEVEGGGEGEVEVEVEERDGEFVSPGATAVFLDLPAPWLALPHLTRNTRPLPSSLPTSTALTPTPSPAPPTTSTLQDHTGPDHDPDPDPTEANNNDNDNNDDATTTPTTPSALSATETVRICTFSPCIEQVTRTVSVLRKLGWVEIEMHELQHRRVEVRRHTRRGYEAGAGPRTVAEAVQRLKWVGEYRSTKKEKDAMQCAWAGGATGVGGGGGGGNGGGQLVTRFEPEVKTHTSYLVFAVLPREWVPSQEAAVQSYVGATTKGVVNAPVVGEGEKWKWAGETVPRVSKRQVKKMERDARKAQAAGEGEGEGEGEDEGEDTEKMELDAE